MSATDLALFSGYVVSAWCLGFCGGYVITKWRDAMRSVA